MTPLHVLESPQGLSPHPRTSGQSKAISDRPFESYSEIAQEEALRRRAYVDALSAQADRSYSKGKLGPLIQKIANRIGDTHPPSSITVYRWHKRLVQSEGDLRSLIPRFHFRGGKGQRLGSERLTILQEEVQRVYLTLKREPIQEAYDAFMARLSALNQQRSAEKQLALPTWTR